MKKRFFEKTWFIFLMIILLPPVGIILMWLGKKNWNKVLKIIISVVMGLWSVLFVVALTSPSESETPPEEVATTEKVVAEETTAISEENMPAVEVTTTEKVTESNTEKTDSTEKTTEKEATTQKTTTTKPTTTQKPTTTKPTTTNKPTTTQKPTTTKAPTTTQKPTTTMAPTTTQKPTTTVNPDSQITVYITKSGSKYHYENPCGNGTYTATTLEKAKLKGLTACEKCVIH